MDTTPVRLTSLAHGGGCGCKLDPAVLRTLLADQPVAGPFERLLVGNEPPTTRRSGPWMTAPV